MFSILKASLATVLGLSLLLSFCCCEAKALEAEVHTCCQDSPKPLHQKESCPDCPHQNLDSRLVQKHQITLLKLEQSPSPAVYPGHTACDFQASSTGAGDSTLIRAAEGSPPVDLTLLYRVFRS